MVFTTTFVIMFKQELHFNTTKWSQTVDSSRLKLMKPPIWTVHQLPWVLSTHPPPQLALNVYNSTDLTKKHNNGGFMFPDLLELL